jgi:hypothetical protein
MSKGGMTLRDTIEPKSDQLNYDDVMAAPLTVKIVGLAVGDKEQPVIVRIENHRDYKPCKSMRRVMIAIWGDKGKGWIGQSMTLFGDHSVKWGGVEVGGIRISHMTGIDKPTTIKLTTTRGKRENFVVRPLKTSCQGANADALLACSCGRQPVLSVDRENDEWHYECREHESCVYAASCDTEQQARAAWNTMIANAEGESRAASARTLHPLVGSSGVSK